MHSVALAVRDMKVMGGYALMLTSVREALTAVTLTLAATTSKVHTSATVTEDTEGMEELAKVSATEGESSIFVIALRYVMGSQSYSI